MRLNKSLGHTEEQHYLSITKFKLNVNVFYSGFAYNDAAISCTETETLKQRILWYGQNEDPVSLAWVQIIHIKHKKKDK